MMVQIAIFQLFQCAFSILQQWYYSLVESAFKNQITVTKSNYYETAVQSYHNVGAKMLIIN